MWRALVWCITVVLLGCSGSQADVVAARVDFADEAPAAPAEGERRAGGPSLPADSPSLPADNPSLPANKLSPVPPAPPPGLASLLQWIPDTPPRAGAGSP